MADRIHVRIRLAPISSTEFGDVPLDVLKPFQEGEGSLNWILRRPFSSQDRRSHPSCKAFS
jgi:hypothetical protein